MKKSVFIILLFIVSFIDRAFAQTGFEDIVLTITSPSSYIEGETVSLKFLIQNLSNQVKQCENLPVYEFISFKDIESKQDVPDIYYRPKSGVIKNVSPIDSSTIDKNPKIRRPMPPFFKSGRVVSIYRQYGNKTVYEYLGKPEPKTKPLNSECYFLKEGKYEFDFCVVLVPTTNRICQTYSFIVEKTPQNILSQRNEYFNAFYELLSMRSDSLAYKQFINDPNSLVNIFLNNPKHPFLLDMFLILKSIHSNEKILTTLRRDPKILLKFMDYFPEVLKNNSKFSGFEYLSFFDSQLTQPFKAGLLTDEFAYYDYLLRRLEPFDPAISESLIKDLKIFKGLVFKNYASMNNAFEKKK